MIKNIWNKEELSLLIGIPVEVKDVIKENLDILEESYGDNRKNDNIGGYISIISSIDDVNKLKQHAIKGSVPEYIDIINCNGGDDWIASLFLVATEFGIVVVSKKNLEKMITG